MTENGDELTRRKLKKENARRREVRETPAKEIEQWALRSLRLDNWEAVTHPGFSTHTSNVVRAIQA